MPDSTERPVIEAALESGEVIADILMHGEILAEIPVIGTAIKLCKAADSIRDRAFAMRLSPFLENLGRITETQKNRLKIKISSEPTETRKVGEVLFFVLERVIDLDKPPLLAKIFLAYVDGIVSSEELQRIAQAIDTTFIGDLRQLLALEEIPDESMEPWMFDLVASGLTRLRGAGTIGDTGRLYCIVTPLGRRLKEAYSYAQRSTAP